MQPPYSLCFGLLLVADNQGWLKLYEYLETEAYPDPSPSVPLLVVSDAPVNRLAAFLSAEPSPPQTVFRFAALRFHKRAVRRPAGSHVNTPPTITVLADGLGF